MLKKLKILFLLGLKLDLFKTKCNNLQILRTALLRSTQFINNFQWFEVPLLNTEMDTDLTGLVQ